MSNPWGGSRGIGSWAAEAEAEEREQAAAAAVNNNNNKSSELQSFPSLKEAVTSKPKKKNKMSLAEFNTAGAGSTRSEGLTPNEMLQLPTGPKERALDDYSGNRIGGGFSNYGRSSGPREGDSDSSWGAHRSRGGFDEDGRGPPRRGLDYDLQPSRADEASDWGAGKKSAPLSSMDSGRCNRYESLGAGSRADESETWNLGKKPISAAPPVRSSTFGSGYRNSGMDSDRWKRNDEDRGRRDIQSSRPRLVLDPSRGEGATNEPSQPVVKVNKANPFGAARPREDVLTEKGLDWKKIDLDMEVKSAHSSRPSSAHSSRSESAGLGHTGPSIGAEIVAKPRPKVNPFGDAKPREVVLQEQGKDWRKMDLELEHRAIERLVVVFLLVAGIRRTSTASGKCDFPAIFNFGDSNSDTGGLSAAFGQVPHPYGQTFFHSPAGRYSDGRLIIDFIAESLDLPHPNAYLDSLRSDFSHGANFATAGSTVRVPNSTITQSGISPFSLSVQLVQFSEFRVQSQSFLIHSKGGIIREMVPKEEYFSRALYTLDIGQNDLTAGYKLNMSTQQVMAYVPDVLAQFSNVVKKIYSQGGRSFWIHNTGPLGCLPYTLEKFPVAAAQIDKFGCASLFNKAARFYNNKLKEAVAQLRRDLPLAAITYVDVYSLKYTLIAKAKSLGFEKPLIACCGHGGKYNFNNAMRCGSKKTIGGKEILIARACKNSQTRVSWDGIHYTEAANKWVFDQILNGSFSDPPIPLNMACQRIMGH